ncbi:hypothetical protein [Streptomyces clavuligerus]|uniref:hypothetical protein n=1 Tax=Streptomyces clavuligerus TaxID=1901 RepID=UPI001E3FEAA8|nr:hypothetical protein [Streptomyces clavuligerus]
MRVHLLDDIESQIESQGDQDVQRGPDHLGTDAVAGNHGDGSHKPHLQCVVRSGQNPR